MRRHGQKFQSCDSTFLILATPVEIIFHIKKANAKQPFKDAKLVLQLFNNAIFGNTIVKTIVVERGLKRLALK